MEDIKVLDKLPLGWQFMESAATGPAGYKWANNGKSRFKRGYEHALIKEEDK